MVLQWNSSFFSLEGTIGVMLENYKNVTRIHLHECAKEMIQDKFSGSCIIGQEQGVQRDGRGLGAVLGRAVASLLLLREKSRSCSWYLDRMVAGISTVFTSSLVVVAGGCFHSVPQSLKRAPSYWETSKT